MIEALLPIVGLLPGLYFLYLHYCKTDEEKRRIRHDTFGDEYFETEAGAMAINEEHLHIVLYRE